MTPTGQRAPTPWREVLGLLPAAVRSQLRHQDLALHGAAVTFYAAISAVPLVLLAGRLAAEVVGQGRMEELAASLAEALPAALGAGDVANSLIRDAVQTSWWVALFVTLPASMYGEGLGRAYASLAGVEPRFVGWRSRLQVLPLLAVAPLLLLGVLATTPLLADLFSEGLGGTALGVYLALNVDWIAVSVPLVWSFRVVSPDPPPWPVALVGGLATGAFVSGFLQGFTLFLALPIDLGAPFGGLTVVGSVTAVLLWMYLLHLVVLVGYVATRQAERLREGLDRRVGAERRR